LDFAVVAQRLTKVYSGTTRALDDFSLIVKKGSVHSLLGRNGAGKTTFTKIISTILEPTSGSASVLGFDVIKEAKQIRKRIAIVPQEGRPYSLQTPYEHVFAFLVARGWSLSDAKTQAKRVLENLGLEEYRNVLCGNLSGGLRQKVMVAMAIASEPEMVMLDEPTVGLDPLARMNIWSVIKDLAKKDTTVFLTTHYMEEAEVLSDTITIMDKGKKVAEGSPNELKALIGATTTVILTGASDFSEALSFGEVYRSGSTIRVYTDEKRAKELALLAQEKRLGITLRPVSVEDLFVKLVGEMYESE
jgi:ABC-2 type transport system ATP-binding protein